MKAATAPSQGRHATAQDVLPGRTRTTPTRTSTAHFKASLGREPNLKPVCRSAKTHNAARTRRKLAKRGSPFEVRSR